MAGDGDGSKSMDMGWCSCLLTQIHSIHDREHGNTAHGEHYHHQNAVDHVYCRIFQSQATKDNTSIDKGGGKFSTEEASYEEVSHGRVINNCREEHTHYCEVVHNHQ